MKAVIQRVSKAEVVVDDRVIGAIKTGLLVLLGVTHDDTALDQDWLVKKITNLRIFNDQNGIMNKSVLDVAGEVLVVSQFTLHASTKKGNRPSYIEAARPEQAIPAYESFVQKMSEALGKSVQTGVFGADMKVTLTNDGPVTIIIDSKNKK